jgi:TPR repeat protein
MARVEMSTGVEAAAQTGAPDALFELGMLYATGKDIVADLVVAHKWFNLAALRGSREALQHRVELAREMSADQIAEAQRAAREWLTAH